MILSVKAGFKWKFSDCSLFPLLLGEVKKLMESENMKKMERDLLILSYLRQNARIKLTDLSKVSRIPVSTLFDRIVDLKINGTIKRLTSLVKFESFGYRGKAIIVPLIDTLSPG